MATYPLVRFVDAPTSTANVRFDFNDAGSFKGVAAAGWTIGSPSYSGEPGGVGGEYGTRRLEFDLLVENPGRAAALAIHAAVSREVLRDGNWLMFQLDATTDPVWFKTYRTQPGELSFENVYDGSRTDRWVVGCAFDADPFAYGERITFPAQVVTSTGAYVTLPPIVGDAATPLRLEVTPGTPNKPERWMIRSLAQDSAFTPVVADVGDGDSWTPGVDTSAPAGWNREVSFATTQTMATRLNGPVGPMPTGQYRMMLRLQMAGASGAHSEFGFRIITGGVVGPTVRVDHRIATANNYVTWVDLGTHALPAAQKLPDDMSSGSYTGFVTIQAARYSGSGFLRLDSLMLLPVDGVGIVSVRSLTSEYGESRVTGSAVFDGQSEGQWAFGPLGGMNAANPIMSGGFPEVVPGVTNILHVFRDVNGPIAEDGTGGSGAETTTVEVSYQPQHLYIGGS